MCGPGGAHQRVRDEVGSEALAAYTLTLTTCFTPAPRAARAKRPSTVTCSRPKVLMVRRNTFSTPRNAASHVSGFEKSPLRQLSTRCTDHSVRYNLNELGLGKCGNCLGQRQDGHGSRRMPCKVRRTFSGSRARIRMRAWRARRVRTRCKPTVPVAPVRSIGSPDEDGDCIATLRGIATRWQRPRAQWREYRLLSPHHSAGGALGAQGGNTSGDDVIARAVRAH